MFWVATSYRQTSTVLQKLYRKLTSEMAGQAKGNGK